MAKVNKALYLRPDNQVELAVLSEQYNPVRGQALIEVEYSGINPADVKHGQHFGLNDNVCGYECCGTVIEAGPSSPFAVGDVVFGSNATGKDRPRSNAAHQRFMIAEPNHMWLKLPAGVPHADAAVLSIVVRTAADALFNAFGLSLPAAGIEGPPSSGAIVIWGGASSVGISAIQLSKAIGLAPILVTASEKNHKALLEIGATQCFDYRNQTVVANIQSALDSASQPLAYVLDTVCSKGEDSTTSKCEALKSTSEVKYASVLPIFGNPKWNVVVAGRTFDFPSPGGFAKAQPERDAPLRKASQWAAEQYGKGFVVPRVRVVKDVNLAIQAIRDSADGKISFEKVAIKHPL
ncbi:hypothetical protein LCI18_002210 [Fusarium solani-melongenae]|uniref:Uncharacterized protein n=1 Tax=Fusarium solani subsp. cucurbitae TaxID=2747967 RepID=A0ACD3YQQ9_FUSSC|nr:hypothetical protein LCI18_002210 [Fusarium solani-melongenae]